MSDVIFLRYVSIRSTIVGVGTGFTDRGPGSPATLGYVFIYATLDPSELSKSQGISRNILSLSLYSHLAHSVSMVHGNSLFQKISYSNKQNTPLHIA
jgi:hypothetical protein